jgi:D-3-phosphoglycerate dehydrogenase
MKILIADKFEKAGVDGLKALGAEVIHEPGAGADGLADVLARVQPDVLVVRSSKVQAPALAAATVLKAIIRAGAGVDNIDVPAASAGGIAVANCPGMNSIAVAELVFGHLLACDRRIPEQTAEARSGKWNKKEFSTKARGLKGSTLGIVGLGSIGQAVAKRALAFEMNLLGWDAFLTPAQLQAMKIRSMGSDRAALLALARECDAITIHVALVPETRRLCNAEFFAATKPGAYFINTSRGGVVDEAALVEAIKSKGLRAGVDVYDGQPPTPQGDLTTPVNAVATSMTHHCGASTEQAQDAVAAEVVRLVKVFKETGRLENSVGDVGGVGGPVAAGVIVEMQPSRPVTAR